MKPHKSTKPLNFYKKILSQTNSIFQLLTGHFDFYSLKYVR